MTEAHWWFHIYKVLNIARKDITEKLAVLKFHVSRLFDPNLATYCMYLILREAKRVIWLIGLDWQCDNKYTKSSMRKIKVGANIFNARTIHSILARDGAQLRSNFKRFALPDFVWSRLVDTRKEEGACSWKCSLRAIGPFSSLLRATAGWSGLSQFLKQTPVRLWLPRLISCMCVLKRNRVSRTKASSDGVQTEWERRRSLPSICWSWSCLLEGISTFSFHCSCR